MSQPLSNYRLSFKKQQSQSEAHCNRAFLKSFQTHAQSLFLRHWPEALFAKRRETVAFQKCCSILLQDQRGFFREPAAWDGAALGDARPARPAAPCDLGLVLCTMGWITPRKALDTLVKHRASAARMPPWPVWEQSPGQRHMCCVRLVRNRLLVTENGPVTCRGEVREESGMKGQGNLSRELAF